MSERSPDSVESGDDGLATATAAPPPDQPPTDEAGSEGEDKAKPTPRGPLGFLKELPGLVLMAFILAILIKSFLVQAFFIPSGSMEPTLLPGDRVLVNKLAYRFGDIHRGDIIVFQDPHPTDQPDRGVVGGFVHWLGEGLGFAQPPDEDFIKRVIGLPGETVEYRRGTIYIDGAPLAEPYLAGLKKDMRPYGPVTVPAGKLFVMGDNRTNSNDSRFGLGFIPEDKVVGKAFVIIWPPSRTGWLHGF